MIRTPREAIQSGESTSGVESSAHSACDYCGLPIAGKGTELPTFCCLGCKIAKAVTNERGASGEARWMLIQLAVSVFFTMNVIMLTMALWAYTDHEVRDFSQALASVLRWLGLLCTIPVVLILGIPLLENAFAMLRRGVFSTDLLLASGVAASLVYSTISTVRDAGHVYFEVACVILVLVAFGRWLEACGKARASAALDELESLLPRTARVVGPFGEREIPIDEVQSRDVLRILPGERIPADGEITAGCASLDQQWITGESLPVRKAVGDSIVAGSLNLDGELLIQASSSVRQGYLARLLDAVRRARESKGHWQLLSDRASRAFFPVMTLIAAGTFAWHAYDAGLGQAIQNSLAVVLIACPCGLAIATPLAAWIALGEAARHGLLIRGGNVFERLAQVRAVRFDKTGTITTGHPRVAGLNCHDDERDEIVRRSAALARSSTHPFSAAIVRYRGQSGVVQSVSEFISHAGQGISGKLGQETLATYLGSREFLQSQGLAWDLTLEQSAHCDRGGNESSQRVAGSQVFVGWQGRIRGAFLLEESIRPEAAAAITACRTLGLDLGLLTGDTSLRAKFLAEQLELPVEAGLLPLDKQAKIQQAQSQFGVVAMVGDGINDGPCLAAANVGIALGCGTDLARDSAEVCLLHDDLRLVPWGIRLARQTVRVMRGNLCWSFGYNTIGVAVAALGYLHPSMAAGLMVASSLLVLKRSLALAQFSADELALELRVFNEPPITPPRRQDASHTIAKPKALEMV